MDCFDSKCVSQVTSCVGPTKPCIDCQTDTSSCDCCLLAPSLRPLPGTPEGGVPSTLFVSSWRARPAGLGAHREMPELVNGAGRGGVSSSPPTRTSRALISSVSRMSTWSQQAGRFCEAQEVASRPCGAGVKLVLVLLNK